MTITVIITYVLKPLHLILMRYGNVFHFNYFQICYIYIKGPFVTLVWRKSEDGQLSE